RLCRRRNWESYVRPLASSGVSCSDDRGCIPDGRSWWTIGYRVGRIVRKTNAPWTRIKGNCHAENHLGNSGNTIGGCPVCWRQLDDNTCRRGGRAKDRPQRVLSVKGRLS